MQREDDATARVASGGKGSRVTDASLTARDGPARPVHRTAHLDATQEAAGTCRLQIGPAPLQRCAPSPVSLTQAHASGRAWAPRSRPLLALPSASVSQRASRPLSWTGTSLSSAIKRRKQGAARVARPRRALVQCVPVLPASDRLLLSRQTDNQPVKEGEPLRLA